jgi:membrane protein implicated in regulation of membrane protease activity
MDIEKLKGTWKKYTSELKEKQVKGKEELREILKQKSQQSLRKLRINFLIEGGINIAAIPVIFLIVINEMVLLEPLKYYLSGFLVLLLVMFLVFLYHSYANIYRHERFRLSLEKKLQEQSTALMTFMRNYTKITYALYFVALVYSLLIISLNNFSELALKAGLGLLIGLVIFFAVIKPLTRYYLKKLYGKHLDALEQYLSELNGKSFNKKEPNDRN